MGADDDTDCVEHLGRLLGTTLTTAGAITDYGCVRCDAWLAVGPSDVHPATT
jgi:hypothetical protein